MKETEPKFSFGGFLGNLQVPEDHLAQQPLKVCLLVRQIHLSWLGYVSEMIFFLLFLLIPFPVFIFSSSHSSSSSFPSPSPSLYCSSTSSSSSSSSFSPTGTHYDTSWPSTYGHSVSPFLSSVVISAICHPTFQCEPESLENLNISLSLYMFILGHFNEIIVQVFLLFLFSLLLWWLKLLVTMQVACFISGHNNCPGFLCCYPVEHHVDMS